MAFISGYDTRYECPVCGSKLSQMIRPMKPEAKYDIKFAYKHPSDGSIMINGYPSPCKYNEILLDASGVKEVQVPIIHRDRFNMSY